MPLQITDNFHETEKAFISAYKKHIFTYQENLLIPLDLTKDMTPPKSLFIEVRVIEDIGEIVLSEGSMVNLKRNTVHYLRKNEVYLRSFIVLNSRQRRIGLVRSSTWSGKELWSPLPNTLSFLRSNV